MHVFFPVKTGVTSLDSVYQSALKQYLGLHLLSFVEGSEIKGIYQPIFAEINDLNTYHRAKLICVT